MADKQRLLKQNAEDGFFADDDPLAELALIASFDPQGETRPRPVNVRREPEFNLEDELLKEFEQFEEPARGTPSLDLPALDAPIDEPELPDEPILAAPPVYAEEPVQAEKKAESSAAAVTPEPRRDSYRPRAVPEPTFEAPAAPVRPIAHPVFDLEDEILKEFAAFDARRQGPAPVIEPPAAAAAAAEPVVEPVHAVAPEPAPQVSAMPVVEIEQPAVADVEPAPVETQNVESHDAHSGYGDDGLNLEAEMEQDNAFIEESALEAMEAEVDPALWHESKESIVADDEDFAPAVAEEALAEPVGFAAQPGAGWDDETIEPTAAVEDLSEEPAFEEYGELEDAVAAAEAAVQPIAAAEPAASSMVEAAIAPDVVDIPAVKLRPVETAPAAVQQAAGHDHFGLDELLADVERYPVVTPPRQPIHTPEAKASTPVENPAVQAAAPAIDAAKPAVVASIAEPKAEQPKAAAAEELPPVHEPFDEGAFELDLSEIELDMLEMEVESSVAPRLHEEHIVASASALADVAKASVEEKPVAQPERSFAPPPRVTEDYSSLPFDPSQVSSEEDPVEALGDMDVPDAPVVDHGIPAPTQPDYDIDIDAEMAHIFSRPAPTRTGQQAKAAEPVMPAAALSSTDLDEFERALEEDFRRSLSENRATGTPDRVALTPSSYDNDDRQGSLGRRLTILAASVAGLVLIGGAAVYAYWGNPSKILSTSSEPKIILADKDPVKIQPKDRGGQIVPNQDKAVYDRVSGDGKDIAKQDRLVTSNEEPVDVVQKTLMPENLPLDDDEQTAATDTTDTADPRLLPDGQDKNITTTEKVVSGVSPRKVRTMVVRSDGTLVPRDDDAAAADTAKEATKEATPAAQSQERSLEITPAATENVPERLTANDAVAKEIQAASAEDTKSFVPDAKPLLDAAEEKQPVQATDTRTAGADAQAIDTQAVTDNVTTAKAEEKPAVAADTKSADVAPVKKEELPAPVTESDTTAADNTAVADKAADDAKPVDQAALKDAANADVADTAPIRAVKTTKIIANTPIPENRPVDQPVDIVGRVTDKGNVQKTEEVASADPVQQPADNTQSVQAPAGAYVIQIASLPSEAEAKSSYSKLSAKFASVIGGHGVDIRKASIKNKGTYYRVRIVAGTRQEATELCSRYKAAGGSCLVSK